ncbi:hypothetical protein E2542_SST27935 [Spatholobus suberectus]|nr:hypothetical protein E2542_SST27935 [Spatholobus suberectus]
MMKQRASSKPPTACVAKCIKLKHPKLKSLILQKPPCAFFDSTTVAENLPTKKEAKEFFMLFENTGSREMGYVVAGMGHFIFLP